MPVKPGRCTHTREGGREGYRVHKVVYNVLFIHTHTRTHTTGDYVRDSKISKKPKCQITVLVFMQIVA